MKKWICLLVFLTVTLVCAVALADIKIDNVNFPDNDFRKIVREFDTNQDDKLTDAELAAVEQIDCKEKGIATLKGIEYFPNLKYLYCQKNVLTALDVRKNTKLLELVCYNNQISKLNVSKNKKLYQLQCDHNRLSELDVSNNKSLEFLDASDNRLTKLDVSGNPALSCLYCGDNRLTELSLTKNIVLEALYCDNNRLTELDVKHNTKLGSLGCSGNKLKKLDVSRNTLLTYLGCGKNQLTALDLSQNTKMSYLSCGNNRLKKLDVSMMTSLEQLVCDSNQLSALDVRKCAELRTLFCESNRLKELNISKNTKLWFMNCHSNRMTRLDVSNCPELCIYVKTMPRKTQKGYDYFGTFEDGDVPVPLLSVDRTVTVTAGSTISRATKIPGAVSIGGLKYKLDEEKLTATFLGPDNYNAKSLHIPGSVQSNGNTYAVTKIADCACQGMKKLTTLIIGGSMKEIGKKAFEGCKKLKSITIKTTRLKESGIGKDAFKTGYQKCTVKCPAKKLKEYQKILLKKGLTKSTKFTK